MKSVALILLCALGSANSSSTGVHPIEKVINLLKGLKAKTIAEGKEEAVAYEKFVYWCSTSTNTLKDVIADETERIEELTDKLAGLTKQKESLEKDIEKLEGEIAANEAAATAAKNDRGDEANLYDKANDDLTSTISAVGACITALEGAETNTEKLLLAQHHVKNLLALVSLKATEKQQRVLASFAGRPDQLAEGDEAAHVDKYDFKSENVIELLKELKLKFEDDKLAGTKAETNALNSYSLAKEARENAHDAASNSKKEKENKLATTETDIADATKDRKNTKEDKDTDSTSLDDTEKACRVKKSEWETRSETRRLELEAMDQAVKILAKSSGVRTEAPGNPIPPASPASFFQVSQVRGSVNDPKMKAVILLKEAAKDAHSRALEQLAVEVAAHLSGPFDQVNNMIEKMIFRLMDEQKQEDEHKHWCDLEIKKTETMQENKKDKIADLKAENARQVATVGKLTDDIADATKMVSDIDTFVKEATEIRQTGKKENALAIKDAEQAQNSLSNAIAVLEAFYKKSGAIDKESWEFVQEPVKLPENPATWNDGYTGGGNKGIIAILENVLADFSKMEAETKSQEAQDQSAYDENMKANAIEKAERTQELKMKSAEKARRNDKIASLSSNQKDTEGELEKTDFYMRDLQPACVNGDSSYGDRKASRAKEIEALKTAQVILLDAFKSKAKFLQINKHTQ